MAGFLDPKQRVMDVILTELGRLQMVKGEFDVKFVSFSDDGVEYVDAGDGVLEPITDRLFFEPYSTAGDEIIPEIDNFGKFIIDQKIPADLEVKDGVLFEKQTDNTYKVVDGYSKVTTFTQSSFESFKGLGILNTVSALDDLSVSAGKILIQSSSLGNDEAGLPEQFTWNERPPLSVDPLFENQLNMRFLPPTTLIGGEQVPIRSFNKWTRRTGDTSPLATENLTNVREQIKEDSKHHASHSIMIGKDGSDSYQKYNLLGQVFVKKSSSLKKYTIIDAGEFFDEDNEPICQIYYLGFVLKDGNGVTKFDRELTIVFHQGEF